MSGVPDEVTDMTRSLEIVERERLIYRTMVFGDQNSFGVHRVVIGSPEGVPDTLGKCMGLMGQKGGTDQPLVRPVLGQQALREGKGEG